MYQDEGVSLTIRIHFMTELSPSEAFCGVDGSDVSEREQPVLKLSLKGPGGRRMDIIKKQLWL